MASLQYRNNKIPFSYQLQHPLNRSAHQILWSCSQVGIETYSEWLLSWWYRPYGVFFIHWSCKKANKCLVAVEQLRQWWGTEACNMKQDFVLQKKIKMWHYSSTIVRNSKENFLALRTLSHNLNTGCTHVSVNTVSSHALLVVRRAYI